MLEAAEVACGENLPRPDNSIPLNRHPCAVQRYWSGDRPALTIDLDPTLPRSWVIGALLDCGTPMPMPWDLLSLDFTVPPLEFPANSVGLATGNTRDEAVLAALCELVEHDLAARFEHLRARQRRGLQIEVASVDCPVLASELRRVTDLGFTPRLWSMGQEYGLAAISCVLFPPEPMLDRMAPTAGSGCHPYAATAALAALREAVQARAGLVAGSRDDLAVGDYTEGARRATALGVMTLALSDGVLPWARVPSRTCRSTGAAVEMLREAIAQFTPLPVAVFDHPPPAEGLHVVHALAPGLRHLSRRRRIVNDAGHRTRHGFTRIPRAPSRRAGLVLFAGPSIAGLPLPPELELRPPAVCGDLAALLADPPAAVGLVDGLFGVAPSVWHKEILALLACGVRVLGAASLGAVRAVELAESGMEGVGAIYAAYRSGAIVRDDAVMLLHAPAEYGYAPLTVALVDAEHALAAVACDTWERRMMQRIVRTLSYRQRTWTHCLALYRNRVGRDFPVRAEVLARSPSLKRADAALLMARLGEPPCEGSCQSISPDPPPTGYLLRLLARTRPGAAPDRD